MNKLKLIFCVLIIVFLCCPPLLALEVWKGGIVTEIHKNSISIDIGGPEIEFIINNKTNIVDGNNKRISLKSINKGDFIIITYTSRGKNNLALEIKKRPIAKKGGEWISPN
ncbi:MAG: hypothetical protein M0P73_13045 [Syntrophobacterales bacterium]|jgi:hypothetical protein|nr:hypothetical protein [Syntrophobacterales bacterium]